MSGTPATWEALAKRLYARFFGKGRFVENRIFEVASRPCFQLVFDGEVFSFTGQRVEPAVVWSPGFRTGATKSKEGAFSRMVRKLLLGVYRGQGGRHMPDVGFVDDPSAMELKLAAFGLI